MPRGQGYPAYNSKSGGRQGGNVLRGNKEMRKSADKPGLEGRYGVTKEGGKQGGRIIRTGGKPA